MSLVYNHKTKRYKVVNVGVIIKEYYDDCDYRTFYALFDETHTENLKKMGFKNWRRKLSKSMVKYIVEIVLKDTPPDPEKTITT